MVTGSDVYQTVNTKADMWYSLELCCLCPHIWALIRFYHVCLICLTELFTFDQYSYQIVSPVFCSKERDSKTVVCVTQEVLSFVFTPLI